MSGGNVSAGTSTFAGTLAANTADAVIFADRFGYLTVTNLGTGPIYARADGQPATVAGQGSLVIPAGQTQIIANGLKTWYQSSKVIPAGSVSLPGDATADSPTNPGKVAPFMSSLAGQMANPGTSVSIIGAAVEAYAIAGTG
jgi:hypothetical protein